MIYPDEFPPNARTKASQPSAQKYVRLDKAPFKAEFRDECIRDFEALADGEGLSRPLYIGIRDDGAYIAFIDLQPFSVFQSEVQ